MKTRPLAVAFTAVILSGCAVIGRGQNRSVTFTYDVDPSVRPAIERLEDRLGRSRPVGAVRDDAGVASSFVLDEVLLRPRDQAELQGVLARHGGPVIGTDAVPEPPAILGVVLDPEYKAPTEYLVRVDASAFDPQTFAADARAIGLRGAFTFSSDHAARLMALITREKAAGRAVSPNFVRRSAAVLLRTEERPAGGGAFNNAFDAALFPRYGPGGSKANVMGAWQWLRAHGIVRRVRVAILDAGFWLDASGNPLTAPGDGSDLPASPLQYDFVGNDYVAAGRNTQPCGGPCPWHGNGVAGVGVGRVNNRAGSAGTGGTVADPLLFRVDYSQELEQRAIRTAVAWGADVVNMSYGGPCDRTCRIFDREHLAFRRAAFAGVVLVAAAGNEGIDVGPDSFIHPCIIDGVICVGAVADNGNVAFDNRPSMPAGQGWASNFGGQVDIWAPTNISVMAQPDNQSVPPNPATDQTVASGNLVTFGGTSAAAPFVAGIAAMIKAINPAVTGEQVRDLLRDSGWGDSLDPRVSRYVNAVEAVKRASNYVLPTDRFEGNNTETAATSLNGGRQDDLNLHSATDIDLYRLATTGPTRATLDLVYSDVLGRVTLANYGLTADRACGDYEQESYTTQANQKRVVYRLPAGSFSFGLSGITRPLPYDLGLTWSPAPITPDGYEPNDSIAQRRNLGDGGHIAATLHAPSDVDYFEFQSRGNFNTMVLSLHSGVSIQSADGPLTLEIYDSAGNFHQRVSSANDCSTLARLTLPQGLWTVRVSGSAPGVYRLWAGSQAEQHPLIDVSVLLYLILHPNVPVEFPVTEKETWFAVEMPREFAFRGFNLYGSGLRLRLLSERGELIAEGAPRNFDGTPGQLLVVRGDRSEPRYLVHLTRALEGRGRTANGRLPSIRARLAVIDR